jgi:hypothetical protein
VRLPEDTQSTIIAFARHSDGLNDYAMQTPTVVIPGRETARADE